MNHRIVLNNTITMVHSMYTSASISTWSIHKKPIGMQCPSFPRDITDGQKKLNRLFGMETGSCAQK